MARALIFLSLLFFLSGFQLRVASAAEPSFPALTGRVVDDAHILDAGARAGIERKLADFETKSGRQVVVATLPSLQGYEIEDYGYRLGRQWGIGQKGSNNGAVLIVAPNERRVRIEVGYGLEGTLTDAVSRLIIENGILPRFRVGDFSGGIQRGVDDIIQVLSGDSEDFKRRANAQNRGGAGPQDLGQFAWVAIILGLWLFFAFRSLKRGRRGSALPWIIPMGGRWGGGGFSGGGGFGGGGFSGGGGSFGGGGASGRW
jgi:uncharacterized protein